MTDEPTKDAEAWKCCGCGRVISDDFVKRCDCWTRVAFCGKEQKWLRAQPASGLADLSLVPNDIYVVSASTPDGVVYDAICCSVPMAIGPEVRYTRAEAAEDQLATVRKERDEARRYEERQNEEIERADRALQRIGMALGSTDEWADQGSMIFDVVSRVEGVAAQLVTVTKERDAALADLAVSEDELAELNAQIEAGEQEG
jgi:predicted HNH restriction endonuclease